MIIPEEYGGLGFSASANSAVVAKLATVSNALAITVMVPNSLGPAELLIHYGTEEQKQHYLPRLARGEEMPAFALTEPGAGSDAGSISSRGVVFRGEDGRLYLRLNWNKRYITLAAVSTVLGLAFKLEDPDNLLGKGERPGITCALIPTDTAGRRARPPARSAGRAVLQLPDQRHGRRRAARGGDHRRRRGGRSGMAHAHGVAGRRARHLAAGAGRRRHQGAWPASPAPTRWCASSSGCRSAASRASRSRSPGSAASPICSRRRGATPAAAWIRAPSRRWSPPWPSTTSPS